MIIKPIDKSIIGKRLRLKDWQNCYFFVVDIGYTYLIGTIFDRDQMIVHEARPLSLDWEIYKGPIKNENS